MNFNFAGLQIEDTINNNRTSVPYTPPTRCIWSNCKACSSDNPWTVNDYRIMDYDMLLGDYEQFPATTEVKRLELYECELCYEHVPESDLGRHQCQRHPDIPLATNIYKRLDENVNNDETPKKINEKELPYVCVECQQKVWTEEFEQHHLRYHPNVPRGVDIYRIIKDNK